MDITKFRDALGTQMILEAEHIDKRYLGDAIEADPGKLTELTKLMIESFGTFINPQQIRTYARLAIDCMDREGDKEFWQ